MSKLSVYLQTLILLKSTKRNPDLSEFPIEALRENAIYCIEQGWAKGIIDRDREGNVSCVSISLLEPFGLRLVETSKDISIELLKKRAMEALK